jgi:hypothetical protein
VNAEFNWWLLIVGLVGGAGLVWLILGDWSRREEEVGDAERARESEWIAETMRDEGAPIDAATAEEVLRRHRVWLRETGDYDPLDEEWAMTTDAESAPEREPEPEVPREPAASMVPHVEPPENAGGPTAAARGGAPPQHPD